MEVRKINFWKQLPYIEEAIETADFVSFDLEYAGVATDGSTKNSLGQKQTVEERYLKIKNAADKFPIFQLGICCVEFDCSTHTYITKPFNFYVNPSVDSRLGIGRVFSAQGEAIEFLDENGFDFNALFRFGMRYTSRKEDEAVRAKRMEHEMYKEDISVDGDAEELMASVKQQINAWLADEKRHFPFLNITTSTGLINGYQKRLIHQLVRAEYPQLSSSGRKEFLQVSFKDEEKEKKDKEFKDSRFERELKEAAGIRVIIDKLMSSNVILVGHNCFGDLLYLYRTFVGELPPTLSAFKEWIKRDFRMVIDTKYLATYSEPAGIKSRSSLQEIHEGLLTQMIPRIDIAPLHRSYAVKQGGFHEAGFDAWVTSEAMLRKALQLYVLEYEDPASTSSCPPSPSLSSSSSSSPPSSCSSPPFFGRKIPNGYVLKPRTILLELEDTPHKAVLPAWDHDFWSFFGDCLRVNGTAEGLIAFR